MKGENVPKPMYLSRTVGFFKPNCSDNRNIQIHYQFLSNVKVMPFGTTPDKPFNEWKWEYWLKSCLEVILKKEMIKQWIVNDINHMTTKSMSPHRSENLKTQTVVESAFKYLMCAGSLWIFGTVWEQKIEQTWVKKKHTENKKHVRPKKMTKRWQNESNWRTCDFLRKNP